MQGKYFLHVDGDLELYFPEMPDPGTPVITIEIDRGGGDYWMETYRSQAIWRPGDYATEGGGRSFVWIEGEYLVPIPRGTGWVQTNYRPSCHEDFFGDEHIFQRKRRRG